MYKSPTILACECACGPTSVALWQNGHILGLLEENTPSSQSAVLLPMIEQLLGDSGLSYHDLTHIACTIGPGSFTGIRVGLAAAGGICFASGKPGLGVNTLEVTAYGAKDNADTILAVLRAGKGEWYTQQFTTKPYWHATCEPTVAKPETIIATAPAGALWVGNVEHPDIRITPAAPKADTLAMLAAEKKDHLPLIPLYIRAPDAKTSKELAQEKL